MRAALKELGLLFGGFGFICVWFEGFFFGWWEEVGREMVGTGTIGWYLWMLDRIGRRT